ncbi:MAG: hypothetical protein QOJ07_3105 [Thermoleophilaceae bacterium]|nr:hypothetical protein [Thermoleophilaceae bacterium]
MRRGLYDGRPVRTRTLSQRAGALMALAVAAVCAAAVPAAAAPFSGSLTPPAAPAATGPTTAELLRLLAHPPVGAASARPHSQIALVAELARRYPRLRGAERRAAARYLARPTDGASDRFGNGYTVPEAPNSPFCTAHFCVHWVPTTADQPPMADANGNAVPDYVESAASVAETSHDTENGTLGWVAPKSDGSAGGGPPGSTDIYLAQLGGTGIFGYTAPEPDGVDGHSVQSYLVIDNDFAPNEFTGYASPLIPLEVTLAHEYNHVLQFTYDAPADTWMQESSATWMEDQVYDDVNDYVRQYLPSWIQLTGQPITQFNSQNDDRTNIKVYGTAVWNHWLAARYGDQVIRQVWEQSRASGSFAPGAYDRAIRGRGGKGFFDDFSRFAAATAEWRTSNSGFPEGPSYPDVSRAGTLKVDGGGASATLDHTAFALADVQGRSAKRMKLSGTVPKGTAGALALVARTGPAAGGTQLTRIVELPKGGQASLTLSNPGRYSRVTAALVNSDVHKRGADPNTGDWLFSNDAQPIRVVASTDFRRPRAVRSTVAGDGSIKVTFSEPVTGVTARSLRLVGPNGKVVSARVTFKSGARTATVTPRRALQAGARYSLRLTSAIQDLALNAAKPTASAAAFRAR